MSIVSRVVAFAVPVALVVAAVLVRDRGDGGGPGPEVIDGEPLAAGCLAELRKLCVDAVGEMESLRLALDESDATPD